MSDLSGGRLDRALERAFGSAEVVEQLGQPGLVELLARSSQFSELWIRCPEDLCLPFRHPLQRLGCQVDGAGSASRLGSPVLGRLLALAHQVGPDRFFGLVRAREAAP